MEIEIGSEFWSIPLCTQNQNAIFPEHTAWYLSGTSALHAIILDIRKKYPLNSIALPSWCCESMIQPFSDHGVAVCFYPVCPEQGLGIQYDFSMISDCDALFIMDYFGYRRDIHIPSFDGVIIRDLTHSAFCGEYADADYYFGSLRKWAGFWSGGFAWKADGQQIGLLDDHPDADRYIRLRRAAMEEKSRYIEGSVHGKDYLKTFELAEDLLDHGCVGSAAPRDIAAALNLDTETIRSRRRKNADILLRAVCEFAIFPELREQDCPLFVPILLPPEKRGSIRSTLIRQDIYCPIHWPVSPLHRLNAHTQAAYDTALSLVCDQRYDTDNILRECSALTMALSDI